MLSLRTVDPSFVSDDDLGNVSVIAMRSRRTHNERPRKTVHHSGDRSASCTLRNAASSATRNERCWTIPGMKPRVPGGSANNCGTRVFPDMKRVATTDIDEDMARTLADRRRSVYLDTGHPEHILIEGDRCLEVPVASRSGEVVHRIPSSAIEPSLPCRYREVFARFRLNTAFQLGFWPYTDTPIR